MQMYEMYEGLQMHEVNKTGEFYTCPWLCQTNQTTNDLER